MCIRDRNYRGSKLTHGIWQALEKRSRTKKVKTSKNRAKPLKGGQKLGWDKIDPWKTKGLVEKIRVGYVQRLLTQPFGATLLRRVAKIMVAEKIMVAKKLGLPKITVGQN